MERILLTHWRAPGDITCMTACVRDLALSHPGRFEIHIAGTCSELWEGNPHIAKSWGVRPPGHMRRYRLSCLDSLTESHERRQHYLTAFHRDLEKQLQVPVPILFPKGDLYLSDFEKAERLVAGRYWLVLAGGKADMPVKMWSTARFQQVVVRLQEFGIRCVQGGTLLAGHWNPELKNVLDFRGKTDLRALLRLAYQADGVLCSSSFPMHVAAAFDKPCVVLAGGREPWWWSAYTNTAVRQFGNDCAKVTVPHRYFHSIGLLDCCRTTGCWKTHLVQSATGKENSVCERPTEAARRHPLAQCLSDISVEDVVNAICRETNDHSSVNCVRRPKAAT